MDLRQLRYFTTIVEMGSFSKAAHRLRVAQPALSQHVRNMEMDLGVELLFRSPQGVRPTEAGETLLRHARLIIGQMEVAREAVKGGQAEPAGEVRFGMPGTISQMLCVPLLSEARRRYPKVKLRVAEAMSGFVLDWLRDGKIDLGVLYRTVNDRGLTAHRVLSEELCLIGPKVPPEGESHPSGGPVPLGRVAQLTLILPSPGHGLRELIEERAMSEGALLSTVIDIDTYGQIKLLVEGGLGYAILPAAAVRREVEEGRLLAWPLGVPVLTRDLHIVRPCDRPLSNAVRAIDALAHATLIRLVREGAWSASLAEDMEEAR
ncbi:MAG TPA: LysR substrate-binding domain-containing protein [Xanthobacteraceae bacterium]|uniref:LysR family transcriptional regulator n=1 Tax=Roseixanthobacter finlandensis TaxID=3119922 RepID=UPI000BCECEC2|nr:MAG: LysR family transcriptional regulator [Rhizobiales bacterium 35-66-30]HQS10258.1 LysR substrate-binding domain-containing protein [Xanthobacteraceae bacterium]HQS49115.1 LysR substrate-binding domain-containing protein [Xanthobacteraceae bacterium]